MPGIQYNAPRLGVASSVDTAPLNQVNTQFLLKKHIIPARANLPFHLLADTINMPKHFGKEITVYEVIPLLDDRNVNDQGIDATGATIVNGNLYGSSRDIGVITGRLPTLSENGGRVNRVGFKRVQRKSTLTQLGFFYEFSRESMEFDTMENLNEIITEEMIRGAMELSETVLQRDLLLGAGTFVYPGAATSNATITAQVTPAAGAVPAIPASIVSYRDILRLRTTLDDNLTPINTKIVTGSTYVDTRVVEPCRYMYVGTEVATMLYTMINPYTNLPAMTRVEKYAAAAGKPMPGEIGAIEGFRVIQVQRMLNWAGQGATVTANPGYRATGGRYDVFPMLVVGDDAFSTIGFQIDPVTTTTPNAGGFKMNINTKLPEENVTEFDPYGLRGFTSARWYYSTLIRRPERLAMIKTVAPI